MTIELTDDEAREVASALRHFYDASIEHPDSTERVNSIYITVIAKLQDALKFEETPWEEPDKYEH